MIDTLSSILIEKYKNDQLASLYLLNYNSQTTDPKMWANSFLKKITPLDDHPDVLKLNKTEKENEYKVDSQAILELNKFINYRPLKLKKKFIFLFDSQDLSTIVCNKLLKIFEELPSNICLILFAPDNAPMIATVVSRAIKLQIPNLNDSNDIANLSLPEINTPQELIAFLKEAQQDSSLLEKKFIEQKIERSLKKIQQNPKFYPEINELLLSLKDFEITSNFNNSKITRLSRFFP